MMEESRTSRGREGRNGEPEKRQIYRQGSSNGAVGLTVDGVKKKQGIRRGGREAGYREIYLQGLSSRAVGLTGDG